MNPETHSLNPRTPLLLVIWLMVMSGLGPGCGSCGPGEDTSSHAPAPTDTTILSPTSAPASASPAAMTATAGTPAESPTAHPHSTSPLAPTQTPSETPIPRTYSENDADHDGYDACSKGVTDADAECDCDDSNAAIYPNAPEVDDDVDDDCDGHLEWVREVVEGNGGVGRGLYRVILAPDGGYVAVGTSNFGVELHNQVWVIKMSAGGVVQWSHSYGGAGEDNGSDIVSHPSGGYFVVGTTASKGAGSDDIWLLKLDSDGLLEWDKTFGTELNDVGRGIAILSSGDAAIVGTSDQEADLDIAVMKVNRLGETIWSRTYDLLGGSDDYGTAIVETNSNNLAISVGVSGVEGPLALMLSSVGDEMWRGASPLGGYNGTDLMVTKNNNLVVVTAGSSNSFGRLVGYTSDGSLDWEVEIDNSTSLYSINHDTSSDGAYIVAGMFLPNYYSDDVSIDGVVAAIGDGGTIQFARQYPAADDLDSRHVVFTDVLPLSSGTIIVVSNRVPAFISMDPAGNTSRNLIAK